MTTSRISSQYTAPALEKGLEILELLANSHHPMNLSEISAGVGRSKSEIFRMCYVLERRGYLERGAGDDRFALANKLFLLGMERPPLLGLLDVALPLMHKLGEDTGQSCHLVVPSEQFMVVIARIDPPSDLGVVVRIGHRRLLLEGTSGLVIVAFQPDIVREGWIRRFGSQRTDRNKLLAQLRSIRAAGYAAIASAVVPGINDLSAPICRNGIAEAALTIPFLRRVGSDVTQEKAIQILRSAAQDISSSLR